MICDRAKPLGAMRARGIALVLVLWVLALLTVMALGLTTVQRTESALTRNQIDGARFRALADAALSLVALDLLSTQLTMDGTDETAAWVPDGTARVLSFDGDQLEVRLFNETSRLDLNAATREQLATLIELAQGEDGFEDGQGDQLADAIIDWRDPDDLTQLNGAEDGEYEAAGLPYGARDEPFRSVEELREVLGMSQALYRRLAPDLTVENPSGAVDLQFASAAVLAVVQGIGLDDAQLAIDNRNQALFPGGDSVPLLDRGGPLYRLRISMARGQVGRRTMEVLVRIERGMTPPVQVVWRRYGLLER